MDTKKKILGRDMRFSQSLKFNETRQVKYTIGVGNFAIAMSSNKSSYTCFMFSLQFYNSFLLLSRQKK